MEASHHASDLDPSSVLGFGSALALLDAADEVGRLLTGALRSMGLADLQAVVLSDGHPMPEGFPLHDPTMGIFPEVAKEVFLKAGEVTPESGKGGFKGVGGVGKPAVGAVGAVPGDVGVPGIGKEGILEVVPGGYPGFLHVGGGWWEGGNVLRY